MSSDSLVKKILILAANPQGTSPLRLDEEVREIDAGLRRSQKRDQFVLEQRWAVRPRDIQRAMLDINPQIIHFSGHGTGDEGLVFEDETERIARLVDGEALAGLFELFANQIECVVLNGCYSEIQAEAITRHVNYVIGMNKVIGDRAAIEFAVGFYDALGAGHPVEFAHKFGCVAIQLAGIPEHLTPTFKRKLNLNENGSIVTVHQSLHDEIFEEYIISAKRITILNTWIPNLESLREALITALQKKATVKILMLYPNSSIATLRTKSLLNFEASNLYPEERVKSGVEECLNILSNIAKVIDEGSQQYLKVRLYNSMPSISVYSADERFFVGFFLHGQLAIKSPQLEAQYKNSILGRAIFREVETLWTIGQEFNDINSWRTEMSNMALRLCRMF